MQAVPAAARRLLGGAAPRRAALRRRASTGGSDAAGSSGGGEDAVPDALPVAGVDSDWRAFRAKLVASSSGRAAESDLWAHSIPGPEQGCLLGE